MDHTAHENIYGHAKRFHWIASHLRPGDEIIEIGCGTGFMVTIPLVMRGYHVIGLDLDKDSIEYGHRLLETAGRSPASLQCRDLQALQEKVDVIIASEVLEHIPDEDMPSLLRAVRDHLKPGGRFLVTVPNGYGWFEFESWLWKKSGADRWLRGSYLETRINFRKEHHFGYHSYPHPSTLSSSPHVQRFTKRSIRRLLRKSGFVVENSTGSVLVAGPFSNLFFSGLKPIMWINSLMGRMFPFLASGFFVSARIGGPE